MSTETNRYQDGGIQTDQIRYLNTGANTHSMGNVLGIQTDPVRGLNRGSNTESQGNAIAIQTDSGTNQRLYRNDKWKDLYVVFTTPGINISLEKKVTKEYLELSLNLNFIDLVDRVSYIQGIFLE